VSISYPLLPVSIVLEGRSCLVVGGRKTALGRARALLVAGAKVTVVAIDVDAELESLEVTLERRPYAAGEAASYSLVICATGDVAVNAQVRADAEAAGVLVNAVDDLEHSSVHFPAVHRAGPITVAVSSEAQSPALARWVRDEVARHLDGDIDLLVDVVVPIRAALRGAGLSTEGRDWMGLIDAVRSLAATDGEAAARAYGERWLADALAQKPT
jgi:precorrin-2 dehydrogenase / sirohydrochlorin ferrochelatase